MPDENQPEKSLQVVQSGVDKPPDALAWLDAAERYAYDHFLAHRALPGAQYAALAPSVTLGMEVLYVKGGKTLAEIRALFPQFRLAQVVHAAVDQSWHLKRAAAAALTAQRAAVRAELALHEGMELAADVMAAIRRLHGDAIARFLATGNADELDKSSPMAVLRQLKEAAEVLAKLTGKDQVRKVAVAGRIEHSVAALPTAAPAAPPGQETGVLAAWALQERAKIEKDLKG